MARAAMERAWAGRRLCRDQRPLIAGLIGGVVLALVALIAA
ncbi:MAG: hypothetical protein ACXW2T_04110 [Allosphingosinicella sp.]